MLLFGCPRDLRGWEWHYVLRLCRRDRLTFREHGQSVNALAISPDGTWVASGSGPPGPTAARRVQGRGPTSGTPRPAANATSRST